MAVYRFTILRYKIKDTTNPGLIIMKILMESEQISFCVYLEVPHGAAQIPSSVISFLLVCPDTPTGLLFSAC